MTQRVPGALDAHIGRQIRAAREGAGLSMEALGTRLGISYQQVQKYECGQNRVAASRLMMIAQALGVSTDVLLTIPDEAA